MPQPSILYLHTAPAPQMAGTDAVYQEVQFLKDQFDGEVIGLFPFSKPSSLVPTFLYGWHKLKTLKEADRRNDINHIFAPGLIDFPVLRHLRNPTVYSVVATLTAGTPPKRMETLRKLAAIVVNNKRNFDLLQSWGFKNIHLVQTGIDVQPFVKQKLPMGNPLRLIMASAPWEKAQFTSKGIDLIIESVQSSDNLQVTFLWRDLLVKEMRQRLNASNLDDRVKLINEKVDIRSQLESAHGMILLAQFPELVKSYPHSLIESLLCGKPVIVSRSIPMSDFVEEANCGIVIEEFSLASLRKGLTAFINRYEHLAQSALEIPPIKFDQSGLIANFTQIYRQVRA